MTTNLTRQHLIGLLETTPGGISLDYETSNGFRSVPFRLVDAEGNIVESGSLDMTPAEGDEDGFENEFTEALFGEQEHLRSVTEYKSLIAGVIA